MSEQNEKPYWLKMFEERVSGRTDPNQAADDEMMNRVYMVMKQKLSQKRAEGRGGWHDPEKCEISYLKKLLVDHIDKGDWVDVLNFAAMIYVREEMEVYTPHTIGGR